MLTLNKLLLICAVFICSVISTAHAVAKERHSEVITSKYGKALFLIQAGYPMMADVVAFISHVYNVKQLEAGTHIRNFLPDELELGMKGVHPYQHLIDDIPESILKDPEWSNKHMATILPYDNSRLEDDSIARKYNIDPKSYPLLIYFAPSGNMYKFPLPTWRSEPHRLAFWNTLEREVRYKASKTSKWKESYEESKRRKQQESEEDINKKRIFTLE